MNKALLFIGIAFLLGSLNSCKKYKNKEVYANVPVYQDYESFRSSFEYIEGQEIIEHPGNIYIHNQYIFVCDEDKGVHVVDNSLPSDPQFVGFINIPGVTQLALDGDYLYANSFIDLLVVDISNMAAPTLLSRLEDVFDYSTPMVNDEYPVANIYSDRGVVVDWTIEMTKDVSGIGSKWFVADCETCEQTEMQTKSSTSVSVNLAGSKSKFTIIENYLYTIDNERIKSFDISSPTAPSFGYSKATWSELETLFPKDDHLFVGTTTGMKIYSVEEDRENPRYISEIEHIESCDPVVVQGNYAYVTLSSGSECGGWEDELQVIDVSNLKHPKLKETFDMNNPQGLAVEGVLLFVCDGDQGLKVYNTMNPLNCGDQLMYEFPAVTSSDIILNNGVAIMIAEEGVYQYDYSDPSNLHMISLLYF